ncbi:MAG: hypothetical protein EZS28_008739 [Streblomastix strix]|uniref:Uncharacterized protein n=1 Tax=Streblomastix strix TaxID=222440 RepID=A0A5J4WL14_9EUKA|nr:MAG: hypothetical protein EZS28_008739 [Streblomastix strix]
MQKQVQSHSQQNKLYNQKQKVKIENNQQMNQKESQLMEQMTMEIMTNLSTQSNPSISQTETMDSERMTAGRSYRPLSTEKRISKYISRKHPPTLHLTMQTDQMDSEETVAGRSYRQQPTKMDAKTIKQSITLAMKALTSKRMKIEPDDKKNQGSNNETQHEQDKGNNKPREIGSPHTTHSEQELRNPNISLPKCQPPLITTLPELGQVKGKIVVPKRRIQPINDHDTGRKSGQLKSVPNKSLGSPEARANSDTSNHFTPQQEREKKADVALVTEDKPVKHSKGNKTSAGSKKQKQGFNSENQIEIEPDSETDLPDQLD